MIDLSSGGPATSQLSLMVKPHASDANLRTRFANGSSTSLAAPAPGFGASRYARSNGSSTSLAPPTLSVGPARPGPGFGSRPGTPSKTKAWVNPLDIHFARGVPSGPPTPLTSPLAGSMKLPPTPTTEKVETGSIFGEDADDMVHAVMASVKKREDEVKEAKLREEELERQRETARLDMERLERQKSTESTVSGRRPSAPQLQPELPQPSLPNLPFRADPESRPSSRNGHKRSPPLLQGPPPTGPPTQDLPQPPRQAPPRQGPLGPGSDAPGGRMPRPPGPLDQESGRRPSGSGPQDPRSYGPNPGPPYGAGPRPYAPSAQDSTQKPYRPYRPPPSGPPMDGFRSPSPPPSAPDVDGSRTQSPPSKSPPRNEHRPAMFHSEPETYPTRGRGTPGPERQGPEALISTLASPVTSPSGSIRRPSLDDEPIEQFARPIIQNVRGLRDTMTLNTPRRHSLSMKIEEFEKTLVNAQQTHQLQKAQAQAQAQAQGPNRRRSRSSSLYSSRNRMEDDDEEDDGPILSTHPAPLRVPQPTAPPAATAEAINRPQSPMRGPPRRGPLPRRPGLEEYGVSSTNVSLRTRGGTPTPASRSGSTDNYSSHSSPPSRTDTPQLRNPNWRRDLTQPSPAPTLDAFERPRPSPVVDAFERPRPSPVVDTFDRPRPNPVDTGFNFDFGPGPALGFAAPPTPDSTTWSLASPLTGETGPSAPILTSEPAQMQPPPRAAAREEAATEPAAKFTRSHVPPPLNLKFDFSPDAPSRDPGLWTPPIRSMPMAAATADGRPSTSGGGPGAANGRSRSGLAASPSLISRFPESLAPQDENRTSFMGIGMARGPSIREVRRPGTAAPAGTKGMTGAGMVDSFGTGFI